MTNSSIRLTNFPFDGYICTCYVFRGNYQIKTDYSVIVFDRETKNFFVDNDIKISIDTVANEDRRSKCIIYGEDDMIDDLYLDTLPKELLPAKSYIKSLYRWYSAKVFSIANNFIYYGKPDSLSMLKLTYG